MAPYNRTGSGIMQKTPVQAQLDRTTSYQNPARRRLSRMGQACAYQRIEVIIQGGRTDIGLLEYMWNAKIVRSYLQYDPSPGV